MSAPLTFVLIPAFEEQPRIAQVVTDVRGLDGSLRVVVIDDGSSDGTAAEARRAGATVLSHPFNLGYGAALQTGYRHALQQRAELVVQMDADGQHDPRDLGRLLEPLARGEADLVLGSRFLEPSGYPMGAARNLGRLSFRCLARLAGLDVTDPTSGFQALNRSVLEFFSGEFFPTDYPDVDVLLAAHRRGLRILERPVQMRVAARRSTLHGGLRSFYYVYRLALSLWSSARRATPR